MISHSKNSPQSLRALNNSEIFCEFGKTLPEFVFRGSWEGFFFFQSDYVFAPEFDDFVHKLLTVEGGHVACLVNLDKTETQGEPLFIHEDTDEQAYMAAIRGEGPAHGWLFAMDRFVCASDVGNWCVYCERANDVAVVALRDIGGSPALDGALDQVRAKPIEALIQGGTSPLFPFDHLVPTWRSGLLENYGRRGPV